MSRVARKNPTELLVSIIEDDPTASTERLFKLWNERVIADEDYQSSVNRHAFTNILASLERHKRKPRPKKSAKEVAARVERLKKRVTAIILLNLTLPNGKRLEQATFAECSAAGGWYAKVAKRGKPNQIVGKVLSEEDLRSIK